MKTYKILLIAYVVAIVLAILIFGMLVLCIWLAQYITIVGSILLGLICTYYIAYGAIECADRLDDWAWLDK